jgi:hypothetical protein
VCGQGHWVGRASRYCWTVTVFDETNPVAAGRVGSLARHDREQRGTFAYVGGGDWPSGGGSATMADDITGSALPARADTR